MLLVSLLIRLNNRLKGASMNLPGIVAYFPKTNYSRLIHLKVYYLFVLFAVTMLRQNGLQLISQQSHCLVRKKHIEMMNMPQ